MNEFLKRCFKFGDVDFLGSQDRTEAQVKEDAELTAAYIKAYKAKLAEKEAKKAARKKKRL
ncbi:MAG TPA: hypothetical protein VIM64_02885 [Puia sp.]